MPCLFALSYYALAPTLDEAKPISTAAARIAFAKLPLRFEPNRGQVGSRVEFLSRGAGYSLFLTDREAVLSIAAPASQTPSPGFTPTRARPQRSAATVRIRPVGASPDARLSASERQPGKSNYLSGGDPSAWHTDVPGYGRVSYRGIYPGIDLVFHGGRGALEYDFVVSPGADPGLIAVAMKGAKRLSLDRGGDLILHTAAGKVRQRRPVVYQRTRSGKRQVRGRYVLQGKDRVGFSLGAYDRSRPLVIDPVLAYSTYLGGGGGDEAMAIAVASNCSSNCEIYLTGQTDSPDFPTTEKAYQGDFGGNADVFVAKLNAAGSELVYSTYLGGSDGDESGGIAVDASGSAYLTGRTSSGGDCIPTCKDFPTMNPIQGYGGGTFDAFVTRLDPSGSDLSYSTFLGGAGDDYGNGIVLEPGCLANCVAYLTGDTESPDFPTENPVQPLLGSVGSPDAFVAKLNGSGSALVYSTYLGGISDDEAFGIAVDAFGSAYVTGDTTSPNFPRRSPYQPALGGPADAYVTKLDPSGSSFSYSTYLGGAGGDSAGGVAVDRFGSAYLTGSTNSTNFPTKGNPNPHKSSISGLQDAFVTKIDPSGSTLSYSTYLGGSSNEDAGRGIVVDTTGSVHLAGQTVASQSIDIFVTKLDAAGSALSYFTYLGGSAREYLGRFYQAAQPIALDAFGSAYLTGTTTSTDFPTKNPYQSSRGAIKDAFVTKLSPVADFSLTMTAAPNPVDTGQALTYTLSTRNLGPEVAGARLRNVLPAGVAFVSAPGCSQAMGVVTCELDHLAIGTSVERKITVRPTGPNPALSNTASVQSGGVDPDSSNDFAGATTEVRQAPPSGVGGISGVGLGSVPAGLLAASERRRARALRRCLRRASRRNPRRARSGTTRARRRQARLRRLARSRCLARHGRTPGRITGLSARARSRSEIVLSFRAPGSDGQRPPAARAYLVKQSTWPLRGRRGFRRAQSLCNGFCRFSVTSVGALVTLRITDLRPGTTYHYVIAARDNVSGRVGPRSRAVTVRTR